MNATALPATHSVFLVLAAASIPVRAVAEEFDARDRAGALRIDLPDFVDESTVRTALAALRTPGWHFQQGAPAQDGGPVLRLTRSARPAMAPDSPGGRVDALLWSAGFDRYRYGVPVWGYRWDHLFGDPSQGSAYVTVHGPGDGTTQAARHREALTDAMVLAVEAADGWQTLRPECLAHAFHALTPEY
ncbi:hypothetical protein ACFVH7_27205 [Kitasatospora indigofera]|uniref:hypothetical protein n=1 Tax=Kitasatospora indigofera TaxID=67307 RepID=UPI0036458CCA